MSRLRVPVLVALASTLALALCGSASAAKHHKPHKPQQQLYVSLGDSYAIGYQPTAKGVGSSTRNGFANQLVPLAAKRGYRLKLVNFGCGGATTASLLNQIGCDPHERAIGGVPYPKTSQVTAAERFIKANRQRIGLITVSIGGNDVTSCARGATDPITCVGAAVSGIETNVSAVVRRLRAAAGPKAPIVGITYPDVILGGYVTGDPAAVQLADLSIVAFKSLINPALQKSYAAGRGRFVDVTAATGAYGPMTDMTDLAPYGSLPVPVATVCQITYYCEFQDIHARTNGYGIIAGLIAADLPRKRS